MRPLVVGMGGCQLSAAADTQLVTYALGSCIAVTVWDPVACVGGLLHFVLPEAKGGLEEAGASQPFRYADTGVPLLFQAAYRLGAEKQRLVVRLAGGAAVAGGCGPFQIGRRNYAAIRRILGQAGVLVEAEDVGGVVSRSVRLEVGTGRQWIRTLEDGERELGGGRARRPQARSGEKGDAICADGG